MNRLHIATRGIASWRDRLVDPEKQWKRQYSALETAVAWQGAANTASGLPPGIQSLFESGGYRDSRLVLGIAEHKVQLAGRGGDSQCDVWAIVSTSEGLLSLSVEAKAKEPFGVKNESLAKWLESNSVKSSQENRAVRWSNIKENLPALADGAYDEIPYQMLHRCAAAVIEAKRIGAKHAAFAVQAFESPESSYAEYERFCRTIGTLTGRGILNRLVLGQITLSIGWADCTMATDREIANNC